MDSESDNARWRAEFDVHLEDVRIQHRRLAALVKDLATALSNNRSEKIIGAKFYDLVSYLELHFSDEEEFMRRSAYPASLLRAHAESHAVVLRQLQKIPKDVPLQFGPELPERLKRWLDETEVPDDQQYLEYFLARRGI